MLLDIENIFKEVTSDVTHIVQYVEFLSVFPVLIFFLKKRGGGRGRGRRRKQKKGRKRKKEREIFCQERITDQARCILTSKLIRKVKEEQKRNEERH